MSRIKKTAENLFDDLIKDTEEIPIDIKALNKTSTPRQQPKQRGGLQSSFINFVEEHDPFSDDIIKQEKMRKELKDKKHAEVKLKQLLKKCKKVRVRVLRLSKKQMGILIKNSRNNKKGGKKAQQDKKRGRPMKRKASSTPSPPNNKKLKLSPGTLKTKGALKEMPKQKIFLKFEALTSPRLRDANRQLSKSPQKYNTSPKVKKSPSKKNSSPKSKTVKKGSPKKRANKKTQPKKQKVTKTISKATIEKKFGKVFLQCHVKVLRNKLDNLDATHLLEKSFKESRKKQKDGAKKSVSFKETVSVDIYEPEPSDSDINEPTNDIIGENVQNDTNANKLDSPDNLNDSLESVEMKNDDTSTKLSPELSSAPRTRSPKTSYSPLKNDLTRRSEILKKSDEKVPKIITSDSDEEDFEDASDDKKINLDDIVCNINSDSDDENINLDNTEKFSFDDLKDEKIQNLDEKDNTENKLDDNLNKENSNNGDDCTNTDLPECNVTEENKKQEDSGSDYTSDIDKSINSSSSNVKIIENVEDTCKETETNISDDKITNGNNDENDLFSSMKKTENKNNNKDDDISCSGSGLDGELRLTPDEEKQTSGQTLPLTKPPKSVFASLYESIKSKLPGQTSQTPEKDEDDESFDVPKITELQQFETDDESALLGDPVLGGRDRDRDEIVF